MQPQQAAETVGVRQRWWALIGVGLGVLMATLDSSIVNIALPTLTASLNTSFARVQWVVISYSLVLTALTLAVARLADMHGKKRIYLIGLVIFTAASVLCGLSPTVEALIASRILQAVGGVATSALGVAIITEVFPHEEHGKAIGIIGATVALGISLGPTVGGVIIELIDWHWIFLVNLPLGILTMFIVQRYVPDVAPAGEPNARFDFGGVLTMAVSLIAYAASLTLAQESSLLSPLPAALMALAIASAIAFVTIERSIEHPAVDLSIFRDKLFSLNMIMGLMVFVVLASNIVLLPFYLEKVQLYSTIKSGFMLAAVPITMAVIAPVSGMLSDRFGPRLISALGIALMTIGYFAASTLEAGISEAHYFAKIMPIGIGFGMFQTPNNAAIMAVAPRDRLGVVSGLLSLTRTVGMASGIPLIGMLFAGYVLSTTGISGEDFMNVEPAVMLGGIRRAFLVCAIIATAATLVAFFALARAPSTRPKREELTA